MSDYREHSVTTTETPEDKTTERTDTLSDGDATVEQTQTVTEPKDEPKPDA